MKLKKILPICIYNKIVPITGFIAMNILCFLFIRKEYKGNKFKLTEEFFNHEGIHSIQQLELLLASLIIMTIVILVFDISWWWLLFSILIPFIIYGICWIIEIILPPYNSAYKNICFESEAIYNECDLEYIGKKRKLFNFSFLKYISNKKYPYLTKLERQRRWNIYKNSLKDKEN